MDNLTSKLRSKEIDKINEVNEKDYPDFKPNMWQDDLGKNVDKYNKEHENETELEYILRKYTLREM